MNAHQRRKERRAMIRELEAKGVRFPHWASINMVRRVHRGSGKR